MSLQDLGLHGATDLAGTRGLGGGRPAGAPRNVMRLAALRWDRIHVGQIETGRLVLQAIDRESASILLDRRRPPGVVFAPGYPSQFSLETMGLVVGTQAPGRFGPFFMVRKADGAVIGEIGCSIDEAAATGHVGYSVVAPLWGQGYATEALRALLDHVLAQPEVGRVIGHTMVDHTASRRVMEKAGMLYRGERAAIEDGELIDLAVYEARQHPGSLGGYWMLDRASSGHPPASPV
ncbi:MAG: GNAT family N-acetyltransferase [Pseudonocardiaceae bacterium]|nr:GNAT family N-acetyltransferase [Pseudonocardiaceae bacterium]